jgi:serine/threonine protein phosphatase PrpC
MKVASHALTRTGRRANNEDACCALPQLGLFAVADGMGGYEGGEVASHLVIDTLTDFFARNAGDGDITWPFAADGALTFGENLVSVAVRMAHRAVQAQRTGRLSSMGSTLAALALADGRAVVGHVGDSRVYRLRDGVLRQLTRDHSLYAEMQAAGASLPPKGQCPFANVITRALGLGDDCGAPELSSHELRPGDVYLLCTDGLSEHVADERVAEVLASQAPSAACRTLLDEAYAAGSKDNITAVVVRVS